MRLLAIETSTEACSVAVMVGGDVLERFELAPRRHAGLVLPWAEALLAEAGLRRSALDAIAVGRGPGAFTGVRLGISIAQGIALGLDLPLLPVSTLAVLAQGGLRGAEGRPVVAAIDARMGEVYCGTFVAGATATGQRDAGGSGSGSGDQGNHGNHGNHGHPGDPGDPGDGDGDGDGDDGEATGGLRPLGVESVSPPDHIELPGDGPWHGVGTGFAAAEGALVRHLGARLGSFDATALPRAADLARLAACLYARGGAIAPELVEPAYLRDSVALDLAGQAAARARRG